MPTPLAEPLTLPCGAELPNRLAKAAMTEGLATFDGVPTPELERLYGLWSDGGAGMLLSGNIQVDEALAAWAAAGTRNGNHFWAQISHAGRQTQKLVNPHPKAPSAVKVGLPGGQFGEPVALTVSEIAEIVRRFGLCAAAVKEAGFTGVQVHSAHGYLLSQFLSPRTNQRTDAYGGSLENRARALLEAVGAVRAAVGQGYPVAVKLNSADFQKGGFAFEDSLQVAAWLGIAGTEEEEPQHVAASTQLREAYFVDFAVAMKEKVSIPLMVTGGFRQRAAMEQALAAGGAQLIGLGRPMCVDTDAPARLLSGADELNRYEERLSLLPGWLSGLQRIGAIRSLSGFAVQYWFYAQLDALGRTGAPVPGLSVLAGARQVMAQQKAWHKRRS
jgi:2,4-dienoyl-CoA reductase-like NADH-dependent reductase (Old Yellow Enzyme family)